MKDRENKIDKVRHSIAHLLAMAVKKKKPEVKLGIGPVIENGFYYDLDFSGTECTPSPECLPKLEKDMRHFIKQNLAFDKEEISYEEAERLNADEPFKLELIKELKEKKEPIFVYKSGDFTDICAGPHIESTNKIDPQAFKLTKIAGAYWKGSEKNQMLTRIYGVAFESKEKLDEYLHLLEEAEKRDHKKLGKELDLFSFHKEGPGFPFFHPKGMIIWDELIGFWKKVHKEDGYSEVKTPMILHRSLWETSGHWENYRENMYTTKIDDEDYAIKPMNCPGGMLLYNERPHSYKEFPIKVGEIGLVHRHELSGTLNGLFRVRAFHQDDAHIYMTEEQIKDQVVGVISLSDKIYSAFGLEYELELSTRPEKSIGTDEQWELATKGLKKALDSTRKEYRINEGDGAFYGPKIDFHIKDSLGRTWQCGTTQLDMSLPERFDLTYTGADNEKHRPVMIHRTIYGSLERFLGILTEHFAGAFPTWLSPVQAVIVPVSEKFNDYGEEVLKKLKEAGVRAEINDDSETLGKRVREAETQKVPYILVVGEKEKDDKTVAVRARGVKNKQEVVTLDKFVEQISEEIKNKD